MPAPTAIGRSWFGRAGVVLTSASAPFLPIPTAATPPVDAEPAVLVAAAAFAESVPTASLGSVEAYAPNLPQALSWLPTLPTTVQVDPSLGDGQVVIPNARAHLSDPAGLNPQITVTDNSGVAEFSVDGSDNVIVDTVAPDGTDVELTITAAEPALTTVQIADSGTGVGRPITLGIPLGPGQLASGQGLVAKRNGVEIPSQWDQLATWRNNAGQVLHGALTFFTDQADANGELSIEQGVPVVGASVSKAEIAAAMVNDWYIQFGSDSLSVRDLLDGTVAPLQDYTHMSGPLMSDYCLGGFLRAGGTGLEHGALQAYFTVRGYKSGAGVDNIRVKFVLENTAATAAQAPAGSFTDTVTIVANGVTVKNSVETIHRDCRYTFEAWLTDPQVLPRLAPQQLIDSRVVPAMKIAPDGYGDSGTVLESRLSGFSTSAEFNSTFDGNDNMTGGGQANWIGPLDYEGAAYMVSGDARAFDAMKFVSYKGRWVGQPPAFGRGWRPRDHDTGYCVDIDVKTVDRTDAAAYAFTGSLVNDHAHLHQAGLLPYVLTADYDFLEEMQLIATGSLIEGNLVGYDTAIDRILQDRGRGWAIREMGNAAALTPDAHPLRASVYSVLGHACRRAADRDWKDNDLLGWNLTQGNSQGLFEPTSAEEETAPWMQDYWTWAHGRVVELGMGGVSSNAGQQAWDWRKLSIAPRFDISANPVMPPQDAGQYRLDMVANTYADDPTPLTDWAAVAAENTRIGRFDPAPYPAWTTGDAISSDTTAAHYCEYFNLAFCMYLTVEEPVNAEAWWDEFNTRSRGWGANDGYSNYPCWASRPRQFA